MALFADRFLRFPNHDSYVVGPRRSLLWPVHVWRVLYPEPSYSDINVFQQAILGLARAKTMDIAEVSGLLGLAPELVGFILGHELTPRNLMDSRGITEKGLEALDTLEYAKSRQLVGYAFQDAVTGELLPRRSTRIPEIESNGLKDGFPEFLLDRGKGETDCPYSVPGSSTTKVMLNNKDYFDAYARYRRDYNNAQLLSDDDDVVVPDRVKMSGIELIDENPVPMYLWCWLFKDKSSDKPWLVSDPFGLRKASPWMSERVRALAPTLSPLAKRLAGLLGADPDEQVTLETLDEREEQIMWKVLSDYNWASRVPQLAEYLPAFLRVRDLVELRDKPSQEQLDSLLSEAQKLGEGALQWMLGRWPAFSNHRLPTTKEWSSRSDAILTFRSLNLKIVNNVVADGLAGQQPWIIKKARNYRDRSLKALLAAALLSSSEYPDYPLNLAGIGTNDLERLINLADARNKAGHASGKRFYKAETLSYADFILEWVLKFKEWY